MNRGEKRRQQNLSKKAVRKSPDHGLNGNQEPLTLAMQHHSAGRLFEAESLYQQILQADPNQPVVLHFLGVLAHQMGKRDVAVDLIGRALAVHPDYAEAHNSFGIVLKEQQKLNDAVASYHKALSINPDYAEAHYNLGNAHKEQGKLDDAIASYQKALRIKPDYPEAHNNLGLVLMEQGKVNDALASYRVALSINSDYHEAHNNLGMALMKQGKVCEAVASYHKALATKSDYTQARLNLGLALEQQGELEKAIACFKNVLEIEPDDEQHGARLHLARLGEGEIPERTPKNYMTRFYRSKSKSWGQSSSHYRGHQLVKEAIECIIEKEQETVVLDLGCGTGNLAGFLRSYANKLDGVDLSPDMLEKSAERDVYDTLVQKDLIMYLEKTPNSYGLIVAAAVLIHFADLETVFSRVWDRLNENGKFVFSLFKAQENEIELNSFIMYSHSHLYINQLADRTGFKVCYQKEDVHEYHGEHAVTGLVYLLEKKPIN